MEGCRTAWGWPRDRKCVLNHAAQCGYLAAIDKDLTQRAVEELSRSHSGIVDHLSDKVGVVMKKRTHEDLNIASFSKILGDPAPPLKCSKTEPLLSVDKIPRASESGSKQVIHPGQNFAEMFQMEGKKELKEDGDQALIEFVICCGIPPHVLQKRHLRKFVNALNGKYTLPSSHRAAPLYRYARNVERYNVSIVSQACFPQKK